MGLIALISYIDNTKHPTDISHIPNAEHKLQLHVKKKKNYSAHRNLPCPHDLSSYFTQFPEPFSSALLILTG